MLRSGSKTFIVIAAHRRCLNQSPGWIVHSVHSIQGFFTAGTMLPYYQALNVVHELFCSAAASTASGNKAK